MPEGGEILDLESTDQYLSRSQNGPVGLEPPEAYLKRVKAAIRWHKARAANWVANILVGGLVASLPFYVLTVWLIGGVQPADINAVFTKWYDVVAPLLGAVIGALFGMSIARGQKDENE